MINLIPAEEKKAITHDFYCRLLTVLFFALGTATLILSIIIMPSYLLSFSKIASIESRLETKQNEVMPEIDQKAMADIKNLNNKLSLIKQAMDKKYVFSEKIILETIAQKTPGVKIRRIFYQNDPYLGRTITVSGVASSREELLQFRKAFENSSTFKNVNLPISDFVKGSDINFNLNLTAI